MKDGNNFNIMWQLTPITKKALKTTKGFQSNRLLYVCEHQILSIATDCQLEVIQLKLRLFV